jgi:hypothetical protein
MTNVNKKSPITIGSKRIHFGYFVRKKNYQLILILLDLEKLGINVDNPHNLKKPFIRSDFDFKKFIKCYAAWENCCIRLESQDHSKNAVHFSKFFLFLESLENSPFWTPEHHTLFNLATRLLEKHKAKKEEESLEKQKRARKNNMGK